MPFCAPLPVPTIIAVGVASPKAQGQEITRTAIPIDSEKAKDLPISSHTITATTAMAITIGTNTPLTRSASLAIGALEELASSTKRIICDNVVSSPTFVAFIRKYPALLTVAPMTVSPTSFSTGMLSPVITASSTEVFPSTIIPSTGMVLPGLITIISFKTTSSDGISSSFPSRMTNAVFGARFISFVIASDVFPFARVSKYLPSVIKVKIIPADSKYKSMVY